MSIQYQNIAKFVALRAVQIAGGDAAARKTSYAQGSIESQMDGVEVPWGALKSDILAHEKALAAMCANSTNPIFRAALAAQSSDLASGSDLPATDASGFQFVGAIGGYVDSANGTPLTEQDLNTINRFTTNSGDFFKVDRYYFHVEGRTLFHTRPLARAKGCSWDYATQSNAYDQAVTQPTDKTFTAANVSAANDTITVNAHGFYTGLRIQFALGVASSLPAPLAVLTDYYVIVIDANTIKVATTRANAFTATAIDLTTAGVDPANTIVVQEGTGGGASPLPAELELLWGCRVLATLPQEDWFVAEAGIYAQTATKLEIELFEGKVAKLSMPSMPRTVSRVNPAAD